MRQTGRTAWITGSSEGSGALSRKRLPRRDTTLCFMDVIPPTSPRPEKETIWRKSRQYTRCLAGQLRHANIPVNCVVPGNINTPCTKAAYGGERITPDPGKSRLEQIGKPEGIASLVHFLCGPGGEYISGQLIHVDGGEQLYPCCPRFSLRKLSR